jgi:DNA-binding NarL/FixJ family response regulator
VTESAPVRVLLVEDNEVYRDSLVFLLGRYDGIEVVGGVAEGYSAAKAATELRADVAVVDYRLPDVDGGEAADQIRTRRPHMGIVFLSASAGESEVDAARRLGGSFLRKDDGVDALVDAIREAARGRRPS